MGWWTISRSSKMNIIFYFFFFFFLVLIGHSIWLYLLKKGISLSLSPPKMPSVWVTPPQPSHGQFSWRCPFPLWNQQYYLVPNCFKKFLKDLGLIDDIFSMSKTSMDDHLILRLAVGLLKLLLGSSVLPFLLRFSTSLSPSGLFHIHILLCKSKSKWLITTSEVI